MKYRSLRKMRKFILFIPLGAFYLLGDVLINGESVIDEYDINENSLGFFLSAFIQAISISLLIIYLFFIIFV